VESVRKRLERLERLNPGEERQPRSPEHVYARIREDARESIAASLRDGDEPLYRIAENGDVLFADGRPVNHLGDFIRALDERIAALNAEIAAEEERIEEGENGWET
jgi:flagellar biosynthesis chaperone FliJ